ncbi:MAG: hypothetical protein ETSY1_18600 [Candidatus Entotheonella factor]|uniref:Uncharacterized protein n=1 Tax=Entotheonella factor TaxID=1429438 RepID=W4LM85_ENTF1|nr:hypothetical protein [Candidatus Entotheonella palauensis]ETW98471.1 MAG: hypothetical protein ETSY1_18600 [Candidatus Entotheonella factor]
MIRVHTERIKPPRALWVPFELGRPIGAPDNPAFQTRVVRAALELLERPTGPVLEDFPDDEPEGTPSEMPLACPVSFAAQVAELDAEGELLNAFQAEVEGLRNWYDVAVSQRGRTTADTTGLAPEVVADFIAAFARGEEPDNPLSEVSLGTALKMASEDLKAYYNESVTAQPGRTTDSISLANWFWGETAAARVLNEVRKYCLGREGGEYQRLGTTLLVPRRQLHRFEG